MTKVQRIGNLITAVVMIAFAGLLFVSPVEGLPVVAIVVSISFTVRGLRRLVYYYTMARHMVGGKNVLYRGIIMVDAGLFTGTIIDNSAYIIILYVAGLHLFAGLIDVLRSREAKAVGASWRFTMAFGTTDVLLGTAVIVSGFYMHDLRIAVYVYAVGLVYSAMLRAAAAFRRTAIVYIQ